jgi:hypothetical protein
MYYYYFSIPFSFPFYNLEARDFFYKFRCFHVNVQVQNLVHVNTMVMYTYVHTYSTLKDFLCTHGVN